MKAVSILPENKLRLDNQTLCEIFQHDDCPVVIYSINGPSRLGKVLVSHLLKMVAAFFVDVEGFHYVKNSNNYNLKIFSLCSAISNSQMCSAQELNSDDCLDEITTFCKMFDIAVRERSLKTHEANFLFLWRDFDDVSFEIEGGEQYLTETMKKYSNSSLTVRNKNKKCFLFSYPGKKLDDGAKCDTTKDSDLDFLTDVESLVHFLFQQSSEPVVIDRQPVIRKNMPDLLMDLAHCLCQNEQAYVYGLQPMNENLHEDFAEECLEIYHNHMMHCELKVLGLDLNKIGNIGMKKLALYVENIHELQLWNCGITEVDNLCAKIRTLQLPKKQLRIEDIFDIEDDEVQFPQEIAFMAITKRRERPDTSTIDESKSILDSNEQHVIALLQSIMRKCWQQDPSDRPSMIAVRDKLQELRDQQNEFDILADVLKTLEVLKVSEPIDKTQDFVELQYFLSLTGTFIKDVTVYNIYNLPSAQQAATECNTVEFGASETVLRMVSEITSFLAQMHNLFTDERLIHGDLKPENILLTRDFQCILGDFGSAKLQALTDTTTATSKTRIQHETQDMTMAYAASDKLTTLNFWSKKEQDTYSFGMLLYVLLSRITPYRNFAQEIAFVEIIKRRERPDTSTIDESKSILDSNEQHVIALLQSIMRKCWQHDPSDRPSMIAVRDKLQELRDQQNESDILADVLKTLEVLKVSEPIDKTQGFVELQHFPSLTGTFIKDVTVYNIYNLPNAQQAANECNTVEFRASETETSEDNDQCAQKCSSIKNSSSDLTRPCMQDAEMDGNVYDRARDPPGQRSVYIPPGDSCKESYRLSTYIKFPQDVPVNPRHLASSGFLYTGYKDRVKCFSCGLCVENWVFGDEVQSARWHRNDCQFIKREECGNVPIGGGGLARFMAPVQRQPTGGGMAMETGPPQAANNQTATTTSATQQRVPARAPSAGDVLKQPATNSSSTPAQTARPIQPPRQTASVLQTVELATIPSAYHEHFVRSLDLRKEAERVRTFEHWPTEQPTVFPNDLAKSGFFYLGNLDRVQCFSCGGVLRNWNYGDNVNAEHRRHFPHCKMVQNTETRNIPLTAEQRAALPNQQIVFTEPPDPSEAEARDLREMFPCQYPVSPHMRNEDTRFETFDHRWPSSQVHASPRDIARSGFFFLGDRDRVKCWYCNGGLQNWDPDDEPWTEHAKWFPTCEFLLRRKGPDFVHRMVSMFPNLPRPLLRGPFDVPPNDPGRRIAYGTNSNRAPSPPPAIIDPQAELQKERTRLEEAMKSSFVKTAVEMGFEIKIVKHVVKKRINRSSMFASVPELIDALTLNTSDASDSEDEKDTKKAASANKRDTTEALQSHYSGPAIPVGVEEVAAASNAMETEDVSPSMEARIKELQEERSCKICLDKPADIVFVPCGHLCSCRDCAAALRKCPMCRKKIEKAIRTYMS